MKSPKVLIALQLVTYFVILIFVVLIALSSVNGYDFRFFDGTLSQIHPLPPDTIRAIVCSLLWAFFTCILGAALSFLFVVFCFYRKSQPYIAAAIVILMLSSPATRAAALAIWSGQVGQRAQAVEGAPFAVLSALFSAFATVMPFMLAAIMLSVRGRLPIFLEVSRNFGSGFFRAQRLVALPLAKSGMVAAFLLGLPIAFFDPYSLRIAGGQVYPSVGALLVDMESISDWPAIASICLTSLGFLIPILLVLLPLTREPA